MNSDSKGVLTIISSELARQLMVPCLHHFHIIVYSTICLYYFILQFLPGGEISFEIVIFSIIVLLLGGVIEFFAICYIAKASTLSNEFKNKVLKLYGNSKAKRSIISGLQPLSINLEYLRTVETIGWIIF